MVKLFTHTDLDGIGCAILGRLAFKNDIDIEYCDYSEIRNINDKVNNFILESLETNIMCHITDISVSDKIAKIINKNKNNMKFTLLDHHPTAFELNKYDWCLVKTKDECTKLKTCGTEMYYNWLIKNGYLEEDTQLRHFVNIVRDYDTWRWTEIGDKGIISKQTNDLLYIYGRDEFINLYLYKIGLKEFPFLSQEDELVLHIRQQEIDNYVQEKEKQLITSSMCGRSCGFVFAEKYFSELGNRLCTMHPEIDFVAMINMDGTVSYRTIKDDIDLGKDVAKIFGGGGHHKAAGSEFSQDIKLKAIESIFR